MRCWFLSPVYPSGGGHPGGGQYRGAGDVSAPPLGLPLHTVLHLQTLRGQKEEEEEEEEGPEPARLLHLVVASAQRGQMSLTSPGPRKPGGEGSGVKMMKMKGGGGFVTGQTESVSSTNGHS